MVVRCVFVALAGLLFAVAAHAQGHRGNVITCESQDYHRSHCRVPWRDAELVRQTSNSACIEGRSWGVDRNGIWVDQGCAGQFAESRRGRGYQGNDRDRRRTIALRCDSNDFHYHFCRVDLGSGGRVILKSQLSKTRCVEGRTWGSNRAGVWVDQGCSGLFNVERGRFRGGHGRR
jgi:hypothetical protein